MGKLSRTGGEVVRLGESAFSQAVTPFVWLFPRGHCRLDPAIHAATPHVPHVGTDHRVKPGGDDREAQTTKIIFYVVSLLIPTALAIGAQRLGVRHGDDVVTGIDEVNFPGYAC
jgi:hypothetical protein